MNAWWAYNEIIGIDDYALFFGEAEEIGYKRGKKNREQPRPNDLFRSEDPKDPYFSICAGDPNTLLGGLRLHVKRLNQPK